MTLLLGVLRYDANNILREHQTCEVPRNCSKPFPWDCNNFFLRSFSTRGKRFANLACCPTATSKTVVAFANFRGNNFGRGRLLFAIINMK